MKISYNLKFLPIIIIALLASLWLRSNTLVSETLAIEQEFLKLSKNAVGLFDFQYSELTLSNNLSFSILKFIEKSFGTTILKLFVILIGILTVLIFYLISKRLTDDYLAGLFASALFSIQASSIFLGKFINPIIISFLFFLVYLFFFFEIKEDNNKKILSSIISSIFLLLSIITNAFLVILIPFIIIITIKNIKRYSFFLLVSIVLIASYYIIFLQDINHQIIGYFNGRDLFSIGYLSHFLRIIQELSIPLILMIMVQFNRVFLFIQSSKEILFNLWMIAIPLIFLSFLLAKIDMIGSSLIYLVTVLLIPSGALLKDFYIKALSSKLAVIILFLFSIIFAVYLLGQKINDLKIIKLDLLL